MKDYVKIGEELRIKRKQLKYSLEEVAEKVGVSVNYLSLIERGTGKNPSSEVLSRLAEAYEFDEIVLFDAFDKVPTRILTFIKSNEEFKRTLYDICYDESLSKEEKEKFFIEVARHYTNIKNN